MAKKMDTQQIDMLSKILVIIGGLNWLLVGAFSFDLVQYLFGSISILARIIYILVGLAAVYMAYGMYVAKKK